LAGAQASEGAGLNRRCRSGRRGDAARASGPGGVRRRELSL